MITVADVCQWMEDQAPLCLSESWDNTGLLLGDNADPVSRIQTCLTLTRESVSEALDMRANLVITHHPLPFKPLTRITTASPQGELLWKLARSGISVYSPHTAWDSAAMGINSMLAQRLELQDVRPLIPSTLTGFQDVGAGRIGSLPSACSVRTLADRMLGLIPDCRNRGFDTEKPVRKVAIACGSGGTLLEHALKENCELFLTGEATFHTCLEAQCAGVSLLMIGHFASEKFAMNELAERLAARFPALHCWSSKQEMDPVRRFL